MSLYVFHFTGTPNMKNIMRREMEKFILNATKREMQKERS